MVADGVLKKHLIVIIVTYGNPERARNTSDAAP
jgi:hypothetical protein